MVKKSASAAVVNLIALAAKKTGWSIAKLNRHLGKGENTLHRWRAGTMENFELASLIELCRLAEVSMDDAFGVTHKVTAQAEPDSATESATGMERRMAKLEERLQTVQPLIQIMDGFSALIARQLAETWSKVGVNPPDVSSMTNSKIIEAIELTQKKADGVQQSAQEIEQDQAREGA